MASKHDECPCDRDKAIDPWCAAAGMCEREFEDTDDRVVPCETCGTEGRLIHWSGRCDQYGNPMEYSEPCPCCDETGGEVIKTLPIEMEDLDHI